ncbi:4223_t:CDS:2 [Entrophospora sp. SA101]|nr:4223_t:CDS:2 [Entrophospora sp. SA101]
MKVGPSPLSFCGLLEDPGCTPPKDMWSMTVDPEEAPNTPEHIVR